jgi:hypothetical protein
MDIDLFAKVGALILGSISTLKLTYDWLHGRQGRLRDEYKFANDFLRDLAQNKSMHPFVKQKGYQAIAGDTRLSASEIEYLLTLHDSARALRDYVLGRPYLEHYATAQESQIAFQPKYKGRWPRLWRKSVYITMYFLFFVGAFAPLVLPAFKSLQASQALVLFTFSFMLLIPPGFLALRAGVRIVRAEVLVNSQHKHSEGILHA